MLNLAWCLLAEQKRLRNARFGKDGMKSAALPDELVPSVMVSSAQKAKGIRSNTLKIVKYFQTKNYILCTLHLVNI